MDARDKALTYFHKRLAISGRLSCAQRKAYLATREHRRAEADAARVPRFAKINGAQTRKIAPAWYQAALLEAAGLDPEGQIIVSYPSDGYAICWSNGTAWRVQFSLGRDGSVSVRSVEAIADES